MIIFVVSKSTLQGTNCEIEFNLCESEKNLCHNGTCVNSEAEGFLCQCFIGYSGKFCETDIDDCKSSPCQGEGSNCYDKGKRKVLRKITVIQNAFSQ